MTALPDVPTAVEAGVAYETFGWLALLGPAGIPRPIVDKLHQALQEAVNDPTVRSRFVEQGAEPVSPGPGGAAKTHHLRDRQVESGDPESRNRAM
jgi:tripartite-type tricarboxylate transporter receptor subunit TctC